MLRLAHCLTALAAVAGVAHSDGGTGITGGSGSAGAPAATAVGGPTTVSGDGITLTAPSAAISGQRVQFQGSVAPSDSGAGVLIRYAGSAGSWIQAAVTSVNPLGNFQASWRARGSGKVQLQVELTPSGAAAPPLSITVYRSALATIYGPGMWNHRTACGVRLRRGTIGVASRSVRCGARVAIYYDGRQLIAPVIDRGPYGSRAAWDLTLATARALGITQTATIGTIVAP